MLMGSSFPEIAYTYQTTLDAVVGADAPGC
jgi:hypothetical protein